MLWQRPRRFEDSRRLDIATDGRPHRDVETTDNYNNAVGTARPAAVGHCRIRLRDGWGPTCPIKKPGQLCPPRPVSAGIDPQNARGIIVASTRSDSYGRYSFDLAPGSYTLVVDLSSGFPRCPDTPMPVPRGMVTRVDGSCDAGIR